MIIINSTINKISSRVDKTSKIELLTQELPSAEMAFLWSKLNEYVFVAIKDNDFTKKELIDIKQTESDPKDYVKKKSPAQRLRATLFVYWKQKGMKEDFELFYKNKVENIINSVKEKLEDVS